MNRGIWNTTDTTGTTGTTGTTDVLNSGRTVPESKRRARDEKEALRYGGMLAFEQEARREGKILIAGIDEAGRGPLAGPVVAAAVMLPLDAFIPGLNDSKKLSPQKREQLFDRILQNAISYGIGIADEDCIDTVNILNATKMAMMEAVAALDPQPEILLIDAVTLGDVAIPQKNIIRGDSLSVSIAAASILAKVTRDRMMEDLDGKFPQYGFKKHKGYGTKEHTDAIRAHGLCPIHRKTFTKNFL